MSDVTLDDIGNGYNRSKINDNFTKLETVVNDEILHTTGGNNTMSQQLDMNSQDILNAGQLDVGEIVLNGQTLLPSAGISVTNAESQPLTDGQTEVVFTNDILIGSFYITGDGVDRGRLTSGVDFTANVSTKTLTLLNTFPDGSRIDMVYEEGTDASNGASGSFTAQSGETVTVQNGIVVSIV